MIERANEFEPVINGAIGGGASLVGCWVWRRLIRKSRTLRAALAIGAGLAIAAGAIAAKQLIASL